MDKAEHPVRRANRVEPSRVESSRVESSPGPVQLNKRALCRPRYYRPKYHEIYGLRLACTKRYLLHVRFFVNLFFPSLSPLSSSSLLLFLLPLLSILLLLLLPSSHGVILVSEFLPRGADKKSDRKRGEGHRKGGAIRLRGQIGRDTRLWRERGGERCLECRVKSMEKINTDTTFVALDKNVS